MSDYNKAEEKREVRIHINRERYQAHTPTTGIALYELGSIPNTHELFREVRGDQEDALIPKRHELVHLSEDEHFYSEELRPEKYTIVVNGRPKEVHQHELSFWDVVKLAYPEAVPSPTTIYTVVYKRGPKHNPEGSMVEGQVVKLKEGMIFNVTRTDKS